MQATRLRLHLNSLRRYAVCAALLCFAAALSAQSEKWTAYKYPEDGFRVSFPSEPKLDQNRKEAALGSILMNEYCAQSSTANLCASVIDHAPEATGLALNALTERIKLGILSAPKTRKINEQEIDLDGHKGVELETENDTDHAILRIYQVDNTLYQAIVTYPVGTPFAGAKRFLDSFKLITRVRK